MAVFLLLQQELHSVVQFLNDLISSSFSIFFFFFFRIFLGYSWTPSPLLSFPPWVLLNSLLMSSHSTLVPLWIAAHAFGDFLVLIIGGKKKISSWCFCTRHCWLWVSTSYFWCVFVFHINRDHKAERSPEDHIILWMIKLWPESQVTYSKNYS